MRRILLLVRSTPYGSVRAREALDAALLFSAFTDELAVLFSGDGVRQLLPGQQADDIGMKPVGATLGAFADYDISRVYADADALQARGLPLSGLVADAVALPAADIRALLQAHDMVITL